MDFNVGDRVMCVVDHPENNTHIYAGCTGTIVTEPRGNRCGVRWDKYIHGHELDGRCENGYGWYIDFCDIAPEADFEAATEDELKYFLFR